MILFAFVTIITLIIASFIMEQPAREYLWLFVGYTSAIIFIWTCWIMFCCWFILSLF